MQIVKNCISKPSLIEAHSFYFNQEQIVSNHAWVSQMYWTQIQMAAWKGQLIYSLSHARCEHWQVALQPLPEHLPSEYNFGVEETSHYPHNATLAGKVAQQPVY